MQSPMPPPRAGYWAGTARNSYTAVVARSFVAGTRCWNTALARALRPGSPLDSKDASIEGGGVARGTEPEAAPHVSGPLPGVREGWAPGSASALPTAGALRVVRCRSPSDPQLSQVSPLSVEMTTTAPIADAKLGRRILFCQDLRISSSSTAARLSGLGSLLPPQRGTSVSIWAPTGSRLLSVCTRQQIAAHQHNVSSQGVLEHHFTRFHGHHGTRSRHQQSG